ncbi:uncharacterized protein JCM10292_006104 [Rhodotorula paludigena]|uniref:uncharacterized protein n=1 Tax=Rhodotorula paludigena TaxID=86838 RepID=UPI00316F9B5B
MLELQTLRSWILTCRSFVASGRRALYRSPSKQTGLYLSRDKAYNLLQTLKQHPNLQGSVRELTHLASSVSTFVRSPCGPYSSAIHRSIAPFEWQSEMLRLCTQVTRATVALTDTDQALEVARLLMAGRAVQNIMCRFVEPKVNNEHAIVRALARGLGGTTMQRLDSISLQLTKHVHATTKRPHYVTRKLSVDVSAACLLSVVAYLPKGIAGLRSLEIRLGRNMHGLDFTPLMKALSTNYITHFDMRSTLAVVSGYDGSPEDYADAVQGPALPLAFFGTFKHLRKLELRSCSAMDVARLSLLADSSGATLTHLDLRQTFWGDLTARDLDSAEGHPRPSGFEERVMQVLDRMPRLKYVALGVWPFVVDSDCRCGLRKWAAARGLKLEVEGCYPEEEEEGQGWYSDEYDDDDDYLYDGYGHIWDSIY